MHSSIFVLIASAVLSYAAPSAVTLQAVQESATTYMKAKQADGCNWLACVSSLAAETAACAAAAAELGLNPVADVACLASVGNAATGACNAC